jgi:tetratricopeptide (TPR) repeat protein
LLELARPALVELARTYPAVIAHKQSLAELHRVTARVELRRGNLTASRAASEAEVRVLRPLADRYPDRPKFQADLVAAWLNCVRAGARAKPRENVDEPMGLALAAAVELCARKDVSRAVRLELSDTLTGTATHFSYLELFPEADRLVRVALPLNEALDREQPDNPVVLRRLAENHGVLRDLFRARGDNAAVERENKAAIAGYERALRLAPDDAAVAVALGGETCNYAGLFRDRGQYAEAIPLFTRAADLLRPHTRPPLRVDHSPTFLVNTLTGRAYCYFHIKKFREAAADYGALAALTEGDEHVGNRNSQIKFLVKAGDVAAVLPVVEETMQQHPGFRPAMFWGATHYARLAGTKEATPGQKAAFADGAMKLLTALVKLGFEEPKLLAGSDFDALRARPDFKKMIADLEARVAPKDKPAPPPRDGKK